MNMKIRKYLCFGLALMLISVSSCDNYLEPKLTNQYGDDITWKLPSYAMGTLLEAYGAIGETTCSYDGNNYLDAVTDNSLTTGLASTLYTYVFGNQTAHSGALNNWATAYSAIATANLFLEKGLSPDIIYDISDSERDKKYRERSKGEAYFLRAWWQMELLRNYGGRSSIDGKVLGYVIVTRTFHEEERETVNAYPRSEFEICVRQILADCDTAFKYLPLQYANNNSNDPPYGMDNLGRASGKAVLSLKSRIALLAASPAYQPLGANAISEDSIRKKWLRAAVMAHEAISVGQMGALNDMIPLDNDMLVGANVNVPAHANSYNEILFRRTSNNRVPELNHFPPMWFGEGKCNPSQNLVNAYPMKNGYPITDVRSGYDSQHPYINRDGRFEQQISYNGLRFYGLGTEIRPLQIYSSAADSTVGFDSPGYDFRNTWTGYYLRKGMSNKLNVNYNPDNPGGTQTDYHSNPLMRRAEVWLNLAEALNELYGPEGALPGGNAAHTPVAIVKRLRTLYGTGNAYVDEVALEGAEKFRDLLLNERRLEFAFENMRLWDMRRWKLPLNTAILGIKIYKEENNNFVYFGTNPGEDDIVVQERHLLADEKYYSSPIPYAELVKNPNLIQNAGW
jgi:hypothetical protein